MCILPCIASYMLMSDNGLARTRRQVIIWTNAGYFTDAHTVYPKKYAHGFVVLCFFVVMQSFIMNSHEIFIHIHQGCFAGTGAIVRLPQCQWSKPDGYGIISQCITTTKHSKAKTVCIFLGMYCMHRSASMSLRDYKPAGGPYQSNIFEDRLSNHFFTGILSRYELEQMCIQYWMTGNPCKQLKVFSTRRFHRHKEGNRLLHVIIFQVMKNGMHCMHCYVLNSRFVISLITFNPTVGTCAINQYCKQVVVHGHGECQVNQSTVYSVVLRWFWLYNIVLDGLISLDRRLGWIWRAPANHLKIVCWIFL